MRDSWCLAAVGSGLLVTGTFVGHTILLRGIEPGHHDEFVHAEALSHAEGLISFVGWQGMVGAAVGLAALLVYCRVRRRIPVLTLGLLPMMSLVIQEGLERGVDGLPALISSASALVLVAVCVMAGALLAHLAKRLLAAVAKAIRQLAWTRVPIVSLQAHCRSGHQHSRDPVPKRQRLSACGTAPRGPPRRLVQVSVLAR